MKRVVLLAAFSLVLFLFALSNVSASCDSDFDCPATYSGAYCWNGEIWDYKQNRYCDFDWETEIGECADTGAATDHKVTVCANGCTAGSSSCNAAPATCSGCAGATPTSGGTTTISCGSSYCDRGDFNTWTCTNTGSWSGPGSSCATCSDGYQNQGEAGVDCGGPCSACSSGGTGGTTTLPGLGESCADTQACQTGLTCDNDNVCRKYVGLSNACDGTNIKCNSASLSCTMGPSGFNICKGVLGYSCSSGSTCVSGTCHNSVCSTGVFAGGSCTGAYDFCVPLDATCSGGTCKLSNGGGSSCNANNQCLSGFCESSSHQCKEPCTGDQAASSTLCPGDDQVTVSTTKLLVTSCTDARKCEYTCSYSGQYPYGGSCTSYNDAGESCGNPTPKCTPGLSCIGSKCMTPCGGIKPTSVDGTITGSEYYDESDDNRIGSDTWTYVSGNLPGIYHCQWQCTSSYYPSGSSCYLKKANGQSCTANNQCTSGTCNANNVCSGGTTTCDATNCATWTDCSGGSQSCTSFNTGCTVPSTTVTQTCSATTTPPTINSFSVTPSTVTAGNSVTFSGSATAGTACAIRHRARVVGSQEPTNGGWTSLSGCPTSITIGSSHSTAQNQYSFYSNPSTYTVRWEIETSSGQTASRDVSVTVNTASSCTPETDAQFCSRLGKNCGSVTANDNCNVQRTVSSCGTCSTGTCGGSGTANVCGSPACTPTTCIAQGKNCGTISDNCGNTLNCGTCTLPMTCSSNNLCVSPPAQITTSEWMNLQGNAITGADLNDRVVMRAVGNGFTGKKVVFTLYKSVTGFDDKLESYTATPVSDTLATFNATLTTAGQIYFRANITRDNYVSSSTIPVSSIASNTPPVVVINNPAAGGIYFTGSNVQFSHSSYDVDSNISAVLWNFGDGSTSTSNSDTHAYTTVGQKTISLRLTDEHGAVTTQTRQIMIANATIPGTSYSLLAAITSPFDQQAIVSPNFLVNYDASDSYLISTTITGSSPCTVSVACIQGRCPSSTTASPSCAANPSAPIDITGEPQGHSQLMFNWTFRDGNSALTPDIALGKVTGTKGFAAPGLKNITLQLKYTQNSQNLQYTVQRGFQLFNQRQCSNDGATWYDIDSSGRIRGSFITLNSARCAGADNIANNNDDCCPIGRACSTSASAPGCGTDASASMGCESYNEMSGTDEQKRAACNADASQRVRSDVLWEYPPYHCGQTANGRNYLCSCVWDNNACRFNASSRDDIGGGTLSCSYTTQSEQCVDGYQVIRIIATSSGGSNPDPLCVDSTQTLPCGRPVVALPFVGIPQIIAALVLIAIVYFFLQRQKKSGKRR